MKAMHDALSQAGPTLLKGGAAAWLHAVWAKAMHGTQAALAFDIFQLYHSQDMSKAIGNILFSRNKANCLLASSVFQN